MHKLYACVDCIVPLTDKLSLTSAQKMPPVIGTSAEANATKQASTKSKAKNICKEYAVSNLCPENEFPSQLSSWYQMYSAY
jgi:hypothetical protein